MKKLMMLAALTAGMLTVGDVQDAEAGGRNNFGISIGSSRFGNNVGISYGNGFNRGFSNRGFSNRGLSRHGGGYGFGYGPGLYRGSGYRGVNYGYGGFGSAYRRPVYRSVVIQPSYGYSNYGYGGSGCQRGW